MFTEPRSKWRSIGSMAAIVFAVILTAAACSSDSDTETSGVASLETESAAAADGAIATNESADANEVDPEQAALDFSQCMRDEGLDFPDIGLDADGNPDLREGFESVRGQDGFRDATDSCSDHLDGAGFGGGRAALTENVEVQDALVEFSACVRDQGFDVGDLQFGLPGGGAQGGGQAPADGGADGDAAGAGQGANAQGGRGEGGFDPTRRFADGLGLDPDDPDVQAAIADCQSIIDQAFTASGVTRP